MSISPVYRILLLAVASSLSACGGGGGGGSIGLASTVSGGGIGGGIGGSGATSSGTIDGFGSIFVNGVEFETEDAVIMVNGQRVSQDALGLGMVVLVNGSINDDGVSGIANSVVFDEDVEGPVEAIVRDSDGDSMLVTVLGVGVIVERTGTVFKGVSFSTLMLEDLVEVSGFATVGGQLRATRIEKRGEFLPGVSEVEREGVIAQLTASTFMLGSTDIDYSTAQIIGISDGTLEEGMVVEVRGVLDGVVIRASSIELEEPFEDDFGEDDLVSVQGTVTDIVDQGDFRVNGVRVDARTAILRPTGLVLANGQIVEAEGSWDGAVLRASELEARRGRVEVEAFVADVDTDSRSLLLQLATGTVLVQVDSRTQLEDDTGVAQSLALGDIRIGDFLEVEALLLEDSLVATRIDRDDRDDERLQSLVEDFVPGSSITLLGITYAVQGAEFENRQGETVTAEQFFSALQVGMLVRIKDKQTADGIADEVELESEADLDGELEFEDDSFDDEEESDDGEDVNDSESGDEEDEPEGSEDVSEDEEDEPEGGEDDSDDEEDEREGGEDDSDDEEDEPEDEQNEPQDEEDEPEDEEEPEEETEI